MPALGKSKFAGKNILKHTKKKLEQTEDSQKSYLSGSSFIDTSREEEMMQDKVSQVTPFVERSPRSLNDKDINFIVPWGHGSITFPFIFVFSFKLNF